jgi:hypothetical protein
MSEKAPKTFDACVEKARKKF